MGLQLTVLIIEVSTIAGLTAIIYTHNTNCCISLGGLSLSPLNEGQKTCDNTNELSSISGRVSSA